MPIVNFFMIDQAQETLTSLLRVLFFSIDSLIYGIVPEIFSLLNKVININGFIKDSNEIISKVADSIYSVIAVVMVFWLAFALLNMLINPDRIEDKEKGASKIVVSVITSVLAIIFIPFVFEIMGTVQNTIVEKQVIEKMFLSGYSTCDELTDEGCEINLGLQFSRATLSLFLFPRPAGHVSSEVTGDYEEVILYASSKNSSFNLFRLTKHIYTASKPPSENYRVYDLTYFPILSTVVGLYLIWVFLTLMIDLAFRGMKLFALQLVSPIPIISLVSPTSAQKGMFKKWLDEVVKTYLSLFFRVATFSVAGLIMFNLEVGKEENFFVRLFFYLAVLTLMKTLPKLLDRMFGISSGKGKDELKAENFGKEMFGGLLGATAAGTAGAISGGISAHKHGYDFSSGFFKGGGAGLKSGFESGQKQDPLGIVKSFGAGSQAVGKAFGYSTGQELRDKKMKHRNEIAGRDRDYDEFLGDYSNNFNYPRSLTAIEDFDSRNGIILDRGEQIEVARSQTKASTIQSLMQNQEVGQTAFNLITARDEKKMITDKIEGFNQQYTSYSSQRDSVSEQIAQVDRQLAGLTGAARTPLENHRRTLVGQYTNLEGQLLNIEVDRNSWQDRAVYNDRNLKAYEKEMEDHSKNPDIQVSKDVTTFNRVTEMLSDPTQRSRINTTEVDRHF